MSELHGFHTGDLEDPESLSTHVHDTDIASTTDCEVNWELKAVRSRRVHCFGEGAGRMDDSDPMAPGVTNENISAPINSQALRTNESLVGTESSLPCHAQINGVDVVEVKVRDVDDLS